MSEKYANDPADLKIVKFGGKDTDLYIFVHDRESIPALEATVRRFAANDDLDLGPDDADAIIDFIAAQEAYPVKGFKRSEIRDHLRQIFQEHLSGIDDPNA